jgi:hypothetical protein
VLALEYWKRKIKELVHDSFAQVQISHISRDFNMEANFLSKQALSMEEGKMLISFTRQGVVVFKHFFLIF